jgi:hypothetical protein
MGTIVSPSFQKGRSRATTAAILLIESDIDCDMYAYYLHTFGFAVQTADTMDDGLIRAGEADDQRGIPRRAP